MTDIASREEMQKIAQEWGVKDVEHVVAVWQTRGRCKWVGYDDRPNECLTCGDVDSE